MQSQKHPEFKITPTIKREIIRIIDERIAEAHVTKEDFSELKGIIADIGKKVGDLAEAQKKTELKIEDLAEAQKKTEHELMLLAGEHRKTRKEVGGLSATVGYRLEDEAYRALPNLLKNDYGIVIKGRLRRGYLKDNKGRDVETNIFGEGERDGGSITIIGEGKSQLSKNDIDRFIYKRLKAFDGIFENILPVLVTYMTSEPDAEEYARQKGITLYYSYDF